MFLSWDCIRPTTIAQFYQLRITHPCLWWIKKKLVTMAMSRRLHQQLDYTFEENVNNTVKSRRQKSDLMHFGLRQNNDNWRFCILFSRFTKWVTDRGGERQREILSLPCVESIKSTWSMFEMSLFLLILGHERQLKTQRCHLMGSLTLHHLANDSADASGSGTLRRLINDYWLKC